MELRHYFVVFLLDGFVEEVFVSAKKEPFLTTFFRGLVHFSGCLRDVLNDFDHVVVNWAANCTY